MTQAPAEVLLHIGYHKTGSGWLRRFFFPNPATGFGWVGKGRGHPIRRLVAARPFEFDAAAARESFAPRLREPRDRSLVPAISFERLTGHPFAGGYDAQEIADRLAAVFPDARVLVVLREQCGVLRSTYSQYVRHGGTLGVRDFLKPPRSKRMRVPTFDLRHFEYHHLIGYYQRLFGRERLLVLTYEQFAGDPAAFVRRIAGFAGIALADEVVAALPFGARHNPSPTATALHVARQFNRIGVRTEVNPEPLFDLPRIKRLERYVRVPRVLDARRERRVRRTIAETVGNRYAASNKVTAELTGIDLGALGWDV